MNFDHLEDQYWKSQVKRVEELRAKINARTTPVQARVIPGNDSLQIGEGRRLSAAVMFLDISSFSARP